MVNSRVFQEDDKKIDKDIKIQRIESEPEVKLTSNTASSKTVIKLQSQSSTKNTNKLSLEETENRDQPIFPISPGSFTA